MKKLTKSFLATVALTATFTLSACSKDEGLGLQVDNGDQDFITSDLVSATKQEVFEAMATGVDSYGLNNAVTTLIDLVDWDLLEGKYEIDQEVVNEYVDYYKDEYEDFENFLTSNGFNSEEDLVRYFELIQLREAAALAEIEITDEDIEAYYNETYLTEDEDADNDTDADADADADADTDADEEAEEDEEEIPTLEEVRDEIEEYLISEQLTPDFAQTVLAKLRQEAGFEILDTYLQDQYVVFLETYGVEVDDVFEATKNTSTTVAAQLGDIEYTAEELYEELTHLIGISTGLALVDGTILEAQFEVDEDTITDYMNELKVSYEDQYYPIMATYYGLNNDQEIFDYLKKAQLQEAAFMAEWAPSEERLKELYEEYLAEISARHILVEDEETAKELIAQLEEAEDVEALFIELAEEYGTDGTAAEGGDLGSFGTDVEFVEEFKEAVFALKDGELTTEPVETEFGYHVIYRYEAEKQDFEDVRDTLEQEELDSLYTTDRVEATLLNHREAVNVRFADESLQNRYEVIASNVFEALEEEADAE